MFDSVLNVVKQINVQQGLSVKKVKVNSCKQY